MRKYILFQEIYYNFMVIGSTCYCLCPFR